MEIKVVGEVMIPLDQYPHIPEWFTLRQAVEIFENSQIDVQGRKSLPRVVLIFDAMEQLVGVVRRRDIMRGLEPSFLVSRPLDYRKKLFDVKIDPNLTEMSYDKVIKGLHEQANRKVKDVMLPITVTVDYQDHIIKAIYEMVDNDLSLLPVMKDDKVAGVVRSVDVFREIARILL